MKICLLSLVQHLSKDLYSLYIKCFCSYFFTYVCTRSFNYILNKLCHKVIIIRWYRNYIARLVCVKDFAHMLIVCA